MDTLIIGGGMAYTFIYAQGGEIGKSICEFDKDELARAILRKARERGVTLALPVDDVVSDRFDADADSKTVGSYKIPVGWMGMDIGEKTIENYKNIIKDAKTILWNGPMGVFEFPRFAAGTNAIAGAVAGSGGITIIGGGDSVAAVTQLGYADKMTHISTGGGASMEFLEGRVLPGIDCLLDKQ